MCICKGWMGSLNGSTQPGPNIGWKSKLTELEFNCLSDSRNKSKNQYPFNQLKREANYILNRDVRTKLSFKPKYVALEDSPEEQDYRLFFSLGTLSTGNSDL